MSYVYVFTSAIVVALMAMYIYENERRMGEILAKLDRTGNTSTCADKTTPVGGVTFHGATADKVVELLSNRCGCKQDKKCNNDNEDSDEEQGPCKVKRPSDCKDLDRSTCKSGIYKIYPEKTDSFSVYCEMEKHGGGWTIFQRRINGEINFFRDWESYKRGFGKMSGEHWLGNEHLHQLTSHETYMLRIDMTDFENSKDSKRHAVYSTFSVSSEHSGYKLDVTGYSGDAGDAMKKHQNGSTFSTFDKDNIGNCAVDHKGGWWYGACHESNLNGLYLKGSHKIDKYAFSVVWYQWKGFMYSLKTTIMMIRRI
ncbi:microfibril-associated glycoprotein 4-like [Mytilus edulis]|uniref:microfibril-associated glycoprotein 4-like n=1 Tax=Mytilus edulis TaxID=6550 RepID=UPI0039EE0A38